MLICKKPRIYDVDLYGVALIAALVVSSWLFVFRPLDEKVVRIRREQQQKKQQQEDARRQLTELQRSIEGQKRLTDRFMRNAEIIGQSRDLFEVVGIMGSIAEKTPIRLDQLTPGPVESGDRYYKTSLSLNLYGTWPGMSGFLRQMQKELPFVKVQSISVLKAGRQSPACSIAMKLDVFTAL